MTNQTSHTGSLTNETSSTPYTGGTIGNLAVDAFGSDTVDSHGTQTFDTVYPSITNQTAHTATLTNE